MLSPKFIPLRMHSEFSIEDGIVRINEVVSQAVKYQLPALAITDLMNVFGVVKFYKACRQAGIKPIIGCDVWVENSQYLDKPFRMLLLVKNYQGYLRLNQLLTDAYVAHDKVSHKAQLRQEWLTQGDNSGLICLSGAQEGEIGQALLNEHAEMAQHIAEKYYSWFGDGFYLEIQRLPECPEWEKVISGSLHIAEKLNLPVVATHPTQFLYQDDFQAHEVRECIAKGFVLSDPRRPKNFYSSQYFISPELMEEQFRDLPDTLQNSVEIAKRCNLTLTFGKHFLPDFPTPEGMNLNEFLIHNAQIGLQERLAVLYPDESERQQKMPEYRERLDFELDTIVQMGFAGYFLIVADFINWAKNNGCPVGPGRGSGAGSLVAYALKITDLDPLQYALLFERFLNPERVSMPDFDIDFCQENRGRVIQYVRQKYGAEAVSQIVTFGTLSSKAVIRDVGRVLGLPFSFCDQLSKLIPIEKNKPVSLSRAVELEPGISQLLKQEEAEDLIVLAKKLEDLTRGSGMHAGGVLIAPGKIADFCPIYQATGEDSSPVSMFDKDDVEQIGLVKFDFLGLRNLTIIQMAQDYIFDNTGDRVDVAHIPLNDDGTYQNIFACANTTAVFQFESIGMKKMLLQAKPSQFEEIIAFVALYRPGPMDLIPDFIQRMHGQKFEYLHPLLEPILASTYGIMVYQEQVMQTAQVCGGYTLGGADLLRRAMGKKKAQEMVEQRAIFVSGASKQGIDEQKANEIFDYMEKFAGYGFNKSHAAAYALVAYQTAWLKHHYPAEFMAATMSSELDNTDQLKIFYEDAIANGIQFIPPSVNTSVYRFVPKGSMKISYGLGAIKGTGEAVVNAIISAREQGGDFTDLFDFCERVGKTHLNKRTLEALIRAGAFDDIHTNRAQLLANIDLAMDHAEQKLINQNQWGLFDDIIEPIEMIDYKPWSVSVQLAEEKSAVGFYLSGHPFTAYSSEVRAFAKTPLAQLQAANYPQWIAGFATDIRYIQGKRGKFAIVQLEDGQSKQEIMVTGHVLESYVGILKTDCVLICECKVTIDEYNNNESLRITADKIYTLASLREQFARQLILYINPNTHIAKLAEILSSVHTEDRKVPLRFIYENDVASGQLRPSSQWNVGLSEQLFEQLNALLGEDAVRVSW